MIIFSIDAYFPKCFCGLGVAIGRPRSLCSNPKVEWDHFSESPITLDSAADAFGLAALTTNEVIFPVSVGTACCVQSDCWSSDDGQSLGRGGRRRTPTAAATAEEIPRAGRGEKVRRRPHSMRKARDTALVRRTGLFRLADACYGALSAGGWGKSAL